MIRSGLRNGRVTRALIVATVSLAVCQSVAASPPDRLPAFKGHWEGPTRTALPGPGPTPGQSLNDYFAGLRTGPRAPKPAQVLVLGGGSGFHHDSISAAMAAIHRWGQETGAWEAELRTDFSLVNNRSGGPMNAGFQPKGLADFDAIVIAGGEGDWGLAPDQKAALLSFVREAGKGLVVIHGGIAANRDWRDYVDMIGAEQTGHPFNTLERVVRPFVIVKEDPRFPAVAALPDTFVKQDELYVVRNWSRQDIDVLLRLDERELDYRRIEDQVPPDRDMPIAWSKTYGRGRVFASSIGHTRESFSDPDVARMYAEALKWALRLSDGGIGPHPKPTSRTPVGRKHAH